MTSPAEREAAAGLFAERTHLAWQRTALAFLGSGALLVHASSSLGHRAALLPGVFAMAVAAVILGHGLLRYRAINAAARGGTASPRRMMLIGLAAAVVTIGGLLVVLLPA